MAKKLSVSSRPGKQIRVSAESIWNKPFTERQKVALAAVARRQKHSKASQIDYSDIPALTDTQLTQFRRTPKKLVAVRLDAAHVVPAERLLDDVEVRQPAGRPTNAALRGLVDIVNLAPPRHPHASVLLICRFVHTGHTQSRARICNARQPGETRADSRPTAILSPGSSLR